MKYPATSCIPPRGWCSCLCITALGTAWLLVLAVLPAFADEIRSRAAVVIEESTGRILFGKNPNLKMPPASTTKLMTAMVTLDRLDLDAVVTISERAAAVSPIKAKFRAGEHITVRALLTAALIKSANDAAFALAEAVGGSEEKFAELMNQKVLSLGMTDTHFVNATGLPGEGQYSTVYDLARMMRHALRYPAIKEIINLKESNVTTEEGRTIFLRNINRLLWEDDSMLGGKTGYTREARHCFVCAGNQSNETVIAAILGAPSRQTLWRESEALLDKGYSVKASNTEPIVYFTRSDYKAGVHKASYSERSADVKKVSLKKGSRKAVAKQNGKKKKTTRQAKTKRGKTQKYAAEMNSRSYAERGHVAIHG